MTTISLCMVVRNERNRILETLENVRAHVDEIVFVDQASDDDTLEIARPFVDRIIHETCKGEVGPDREKAANAATGDWIIIQDADELWTPEFLQQLPSLVARADVDCYRILRRTQVTGYPAFDEHMLRFHRRGKAWYSDRMHGGLQPLGPMQDLDFVCMLHNKTVAEQVLDEATYEQILDAGYQDDPSYKAMKRCNYVLHPERGFWQVRRVVAEAVTP